MRKIELLAPARDLATARAAIDCGADAVYIGAGRFGARAAAGNSVDDIARVCDYARPFGVKVYAALNTLLFEDELDEAQRLARQVVAAGVDALIVQDMAYLRMGLDIVLHASTQATVTNAEKVRFLAAAGFSRVILERGLTLEQIGQIRAAVADVELECFIHGAICVGHSGDCYLSRSMGPRSGNRGECSQPCRLTYDLENENGEKLFAGRHLLSLQDLDLTATLPDLLDAGVTSFKIEGRLKDAAYVMNTVAHYRRELDRLIASRPDLERSSYGVSTGWPEGLDADPSRSFSRAATEYYLRGKQAGAASFDTPKSVGAPVGRIAEVGRNFFTLAVVAPGTRAISSASDGQPGARLLSGAPLVPGDGICFFSGGKLLGTNINSVEGGRVYPNRMEGLAPGGEILRNFDKRFNDAMLSAAIRRQLSVLMSFSGSVATGITLTVRDFARGIEASATLAGPLPAAEKPEQMASAIREQLSKTGGTIFCVESVTLDIDGQPNKSDIPTPANGASWLPDQPATCPPVAHSARGAGRQVEVSCGCRPIPFLKSAQINALRREALDGLAAILANPQTAILRLAPPQLPEEDQIAPRPASPQHPEDRTVPLPVSSQRTEDSGAPWPPSLGAVATATNSLARDFYLGHGAPLAPAPKELMDDLSGQCVMITPYCLRRETAQCLKDSPPYRGALYLTRGRLRYRLNFDCENCLMNIILT